MHERSSGLADRPVATQLATEFAALDLRGNAESNTPKDPRLPCCMVVTCQLPHELFAKCTRSSTGSSKRQSQICVIRMLNCDRRQASHPTRSTSTQLSRPAWMCPSSRGLCQHGFMNDLFSLVEPITQDSSRNSADNRVRRHIVGHDSAGPNNRPIADRHASYEDGPSLVLR